MTTGRTRFNICLLLLAAVLAAGCQTHGKKDKEVSTLRVHMETIPDMLSFSRTVEVFRAHPVSITVDTSPFLTEANVASAKVVESTNAGFDLQIHFDRRGTWLLEEYTTSNPGRHMAIFSEFGERLKHSRWLAAPIIRRRISDGILTFTPDATKEEAEQIAAGLNAVAKKIEEKSKW